MHCNIAVSWQQGYLYNLPAGRQVHFNKCSSCMDFHLAFSPKPFEVKIDHQQKLLLTGSCFTEQIGNKLTQHKFRVLDNPNGILFNPVSIARSVSSYIVEKKYRADELFYQNECWNSWEHHSRFSHPDKNECIRLINASQTAAHEFLKETDFSGKGIRKLILESRKNAPKPDFFTVIIKPTDDSNYKNTVDMLDELRPAKFTQLPIYCPMKKKFISKK